MLIVRCVSKANTGSIPLLTLSAVKDIVPAGAIEIKCELRNPYFITVSLVIRSRLRMYGELWYDLASYTGKVPFSMANSAEYR